ncbi:MAG: hypothetical protein ACI8UC_002074, partial [Psychromonas sp.]
SILGKAMAGTGLPLINCPNCLKNPILHSHFFL